MRRVLLDCGTHEGQGLFELVAELPNGLEVHCFEPNPAIKEDEVNETFLLEVAASNGSTPSKLTLHRTAVWDRDGYATFASIGGFPRGEHNGRGQSSSIIDVGQEKTGVTTNSVPCVSLTNFIRSLGLAESDELYVKLDVEGAEFSALKQLLTEGKDLLPFVKCIWVEWHTKYFHPGTWEKDSAVKELTDKLSEHTTVKTWQ